MNNEQKGSGFLQEYEKTQERLDSLYWKKHSNWYLKFKKFDDETFKKIDKYLGFYFISNYGQVVSFQNKSPLLRRYSFINGFFGVNLSLFGVSKFYFVHELVYAHFVGELKSNRKVIHINGVVTDNYYKNLRLARTSDPVRKNKKEFDFTLFNRIESQRPGQLPASGLISAAKKQGTQPGKSNHHTRARPILQFDLQGKFLREFPSVMEAGRMTGKNPASISECARGKLATSGGCQWRYRDHPEFKKGIKDIPAVEKRKSHNSKIILQFDLDGHFIREFPSISHASREVGFGSGGFNRCLSGECRTAAGYQWKLKSDPLFKNGIVDLPPILRRDIHKAKPVLQFSLRGKFLREYPSLNEATRMSGVSKGSIMRCIKGETRTGGKFQWRLKKEGEDREEIGDIKAVKREPRARRLRPLYQFALDGKYIDEYPSIVEAGRKTGILSSGIRACANGIYKKAGGFQWRFKDDPAFEDGVCDIEPLSRKNKRKAQHAGRGSKPGRIVYDYTIPVLKFNRQGKFLTEYPSLKEAEESSGILRSHIFQCIKRVRKSAGGFQWHFKNDPLFEKGICDIEPVKRDTNSVPVLCFDLKGKFVAEYPSITEAAKKLGINDGVISNCLKGICKTAGGHLWKRKSDPLFKNGIVDIPPVKKLTGWMRKDVLQFDLEGKFIRKHPSVMAAARALDIGMSVIRHVIYGDGLTAAGYQWRSINDPLFEDGIVAIEPIGERYPKAKALLQYTLNGKLKEEFRTIRDAVKKSGFSRHLILKCAKGERKSVGGFTWKFKNPEHNE